MVNDDIATTAELDDAIIYGPGLRWACMGTNLTYLLAGGKQGMRHFMEQFGPAHQLPWCHLEPPELSNELIDKMVEQTAAQAQKRDLRELEVLRDNCLVAIMQALSEYEHAAGKVIKEDSYKLSEDFFVGDKIDCIAYVTDQFGASSSIKAATLTIRELPMRRQLINGAIDFIKELVT